MKTEELEKVYNSRPFKIRNADEFDIENILDLFIDPTDGLNSPFDFTNSIIKGKNGIRKDDVFACKSCILSLHIGSVP